jgi:hypothetical protein
LREAGADDVAGQILKFLVIVWPYSGTAIHVKATVTPREPIFNDGIIDFALSL